MVIQSWQVKTPMEQLKGITPFGVKSKGKGVFSSVWSGHAKTNLDYETAECFVCLEGRGWRGGRVGVPGRPVQ